MRTLTGVLLAGLSLSAAADWTPVATDNGIFSAYADKATIERRGSLVTMRGMYDFTRGDLTPQGASFFSTTVEREYDCRERRVRLLSHRDHSEHFGEGPVVSAADRPRRWEDIVEDSLDEAFWKLACGAI